MGENGPLMHDLNYTGEQLDRRLSQGYYDDIIAAGIKAGMWTAENPPSKEDVDLGLFIASVMKEEDFVSLLKKYIDNDTIYFDTEANCIKANIPKATYIIKVSINPGDEQRLTITTEGEIVEQTVDETKSSYWFKVTAGSTVKITINPAEFYVVSQINVDQVSQGNISSYTFENVQDDHTMYVWMEEESVSSVNFLERSDKPGVFYSGIGQALQAVKTDYPTGLDKDITINCVARALEIRDTEANQDYGIWTSKFSDFNRDGVYTITIDGKDIYTIDCKWLGGLYFEDVDNIIIKGVKFRNYSNQAGQASPDELSALFFNARSGVVKNIVIHGNTMTGVFPYNGKDYASWYCITMKNIDNAIIDKNDFQKGASVVVNASGCTAMEITRNKMTGVYHQNTTVAHPCILNITSNGGVLRLSDNDINGEGFIEYVCTLNGFRQIEINRNTVSKCDGQPFNINKDIEKLDILSNLFHSNLRRGQYIYLRHVFGGEMNINELNILNNTVYFNEEYSSSQDFLYCGSVAKFTNYNNIFLSKLDKVTAIFTTFGIKEYISGSNIYAASFYSDDPTKRFLRMRIIESFDDDTSKGFIDFSFETRLLEDMKQKGYETGSWALSPQDQVLGVDVSGSSYKLLDSLKDVYLANNEKIPRFDLEYLDKTDKSTIGAYNLYGLAWDETADASTGYHGVNMIDPLDVFDNSSVYTAPAEDKILLFVNNNNRNNLIKNTFTPQTGSKIVKYGGVTSVAFQCVYNEETMMYIEDNSYNYEIEKSPYE